MSPSYGGKSRGGGNYGRKFTVDTATKLHDYTTKLYDAKDGHGADWVEAAVASFRVSFSCWNNIPDGDERKAQIARRLLDLATSAVTGCEDSGAGWTAPGVKPSRLIFTMPAPAADSGPSR